MRFKFLAIVIIICVQTKAMQYGYHFCPVSVAMGNASCCITSPYMANNIAQMGCDTLPNVHAFYLNKTTIPTIGLYNVALVYPFKPIHTGVRLNFHGFDGYNELSVQLSFAKFFKPYISIGLQAEYNALYVSPKKGYLHTGSVNIGFMAFPTKQLRVGFTVHNVSFSSFLSETNRLYLPVTFRVGLGYTLAKKVLLTAQIEKALKQPFAYSIGIDYQVIKQLAIRTGLYVCQALQPTLGLGIKIGQIQCDVGFQYHVATGLNSSVGVVYTWKN
jgi:hypothetical protein